MKLDRARTEAFLRAPDPKLPVVLLFGPDQGLLAERARQLGRTAVEDLSDPFNVSELAGDQLQKSPARLTEEAQALSLMGGRRLVRVRLATDAVRPALEQLLELDPAALVVIEAGDLPTSSKLRQVAERSPKVAAIPCYRESAERLTAMVRALLDEHGLAVAPELLPELVSILGPDRAIARREIEKLALLKQDAPGRLTAADLSLVLDDNGAVALDDVSLAVLLGREAELTRALDRLLATGQPAMRVLRAVAGLVMVALRARMRMGEGQSADAALAAARPPLHFSLRDRLKPSLGKLGHDRLLAALDRLQEAELRMKTARSPDELICRDALFAVCRGMLARAS